MSAAAVVTQQRRWGLAHARVLAVLYFAYFANICSRTAVQVSLAAMAADKSLAFTPTMTGTVLSVGAGTQVVGRLLLPIVIARLGARTSLIAWMIAMGAALLLMTVHLGGVFSFELFLFGWVINMLACSTMWACMTSIAGEAFKDNGFSSAVGILSTASRAGAILGNLVWGPLSGVLGWAQIIRLSSLLPIVAVLALTFCLLPLPTERKEDSDSLLADANKAAATQQSAVPFSVAMRIFVTNPRLWMVFFCQATLTLCMELQALLPIYLRQGASLSAAQAGAMAAVFPFGAAGATMLTGVVFDRFTGMRRAALFGGEHLLAILGLGLLAWAPTAPTSFALLAVMAGSAPTFYLISAEFINRYAGPDYACSLMAWIDIPGQLANSVFMSQYPSMVEHGGWSFVFRALQLTTVSASAACLAYLVFDAADPTELFTRRKATTMLLGTIL